MVIDEVRDWFVVLGVDVDVIDGVWVFIVDGWWLLWVLNM